MNFPGKNVQDEAEKSSLLTRLICLRRLCLASSHDHSTAWVFASVARWVQVILLATLRVMSVSNNIESVTG